MVYGSILDLFVGAFVMLVGVTYVVVGHRSAKKLANLRRNLYTEGTLRSKFQEADLEGNDSLTKDQFQMLVAGLGLRLSERETEAAFMHIGHDTGSLTYDQFRLWWSSHGEESEGSFVII